MKKSIAILLALIILTLFPSSVLADTHFSAQESSTSGELVANNDQFASAVSETDIFITADEA